MVQKGQQPCFKTGLGRASRAELGDGAGSSRGWLVSSAVLPEELVKILSSVFGGTGLRTSDPRFSEVVESKGQKGNLQLLSDLPVLGKSSDNPLGTC